MTEFPTLPYDEWSQRGRMWEERERLIRETFKHADYPHRPGTLYDCAACEDRCYCAESFTDDNPRRFATCVYCAIMAEAETSSDIAAWEAQDS